MSATVVPETIFMSTRNEFFFSTILCMAQCVCDSLSLTVRWCQLACGPPAPSHPFARGSIWPPCYLLQWVMKPDFLLYEYCFMESLTRSICPFDSDSGSVASLHIHTFLTHKYGYIAPVSFDM